MNALLLVAAGGAIGAAGRYLTMELVGKAMGLGFPYGTLTVNILGSFFMGVLIAFLARHTLYNTAMSQDLRLFVAVGVLGGFTTFSTFSLDVITMFERGDISNVVSYIIGSVTFSIAGLFGGMHLMRSILQ